MSRALDLGADKQRMPRLLYIKASPRASLSRSAALADAYIEAVLADCPGLEVDLLDLAKEHLPEIDADGIAAKLNMVSGQDLDADQKARWGEISTIAGRFATADRYVFAVPMWNNGIPYRLKHYIDVIHQPGLLWKFDAETGYIGLLSGKKAALFLTTGVYGARNSSDAFGVDFHSTYLMSWLNQAGVKDVDIVALPPNYVSDNPKADFENALKEAQALAQKK